MSNALKPSRPTWARELKLFCEQDGKWVGGKFDWISTSRTTRDFANIRSGYNGWDPSAISKADRCAFVVVSKDGKRRTNVIACGR